MKKILLLLLWFASSLTGLAASSAVTVSGQTNLLAGSITLSNMTASTYPVANASKLLISATNTGTGSLVLQTSPTLTTPNIGVATATSVNGSTIPSSKTLVVTTDKLSVLAATTSAELFGILSDETGSATGSPLAVFNQAPTIDAPVFTTSARLPNGASVTTGSVGMLGFDTDALAASHGAFQYTDGTLTELLLGIDAASTFTDGFVPTWVNATKKFTLQAGGAGGTISGLTTGVIPKAASATSIADGPMSVNAVTNVALTGGLTANYGTFTGAVTAASAAIGTSGTGQIDIGSAGVRLTDDGDGSLIITGQGNGSDEALKLDFDNTANTVVVSSSTGVTTINTGSIGLVSTANTALTAATINSSTINYVYPLSADDTSNGMYVTGLNNSGGVTQWDVVYLNSSSQWVLADANGSGTYPAWGLATATVSTGNASTVIVQGIVRNDGWSWTPGASLFLSTTAGGLTATAPSTTGDKVQVIGKALSATTVLIRPSQDYGTAP